GDRRSPARTDSLWSPGDHPDVLSRPAALDLEDFKRMGDAPIGIRRRLQECCVEAWASARTRCTRRQRNPLAASLSRRELRVLHSLGCVAELFVRLLDGLFQSLDRAVDIATGDR